MSVLTSWFRVGALLLVPLIGLLGSAVHADERRSGDEPQQPANAATYRVQPGDVLFISVWKETDLQLQVLVRPDGGLSFPLAGDVSASGLTVEALGEEIAKRLRKYIPEAVVTVAVKELGGNRIYVIGKVNRPGEYPFSRPLDVMQALSLAGGATPFASLNDVRVLRRENGRQTSIPFHYGDVERGRNLEQNIELRTGDTVVVP
jgi:polysaccharide export outer membrane protein